MKNQNKKEMFSTLIEKLANKFTAVILAFVVISSLTVSADIYSVNQISNIALEAYALDTVAGYASALRTSQTSANAQVIFEVKTPDQQVIKIPAVTNQSGIAQSELSDYYTKKAGIYSVSAYLATESSSSRSNSFEVYADSVSADLSLVSPSEQLINSLSERANIKVRLTDKYNNPVSGHMVKLISSSATDVISSVNNQELSDTNGEISFAVTALSPGIAFYTAYDATSETSLTVRAKVVYFDDAKMIFANNFENYNYASAGNSSVAADHFEFTNLPASVSPAQATSFTLEAKDNLGQTVTNYTGTVRFSAISNNSFFVSLPVDYTFTAADMGVHTFSLAMTFQQAGAYQIEARDINTTTILGTTTFNVVQASSAYYATPTGLAITNPLPGTYSNSIQVISGNATAGKNLKIFDNDQEIAAVTADPIGNFSFTTNILTDGAHRFYAAEVNEVGTIVATSNIVEVNIDTDVPEITEVIIEPIGNILPGSNVTVKVSVSEELSQAAMLFNNNIFELTKSPQGFYQGAFLAPNVAGNFPLSFILTDQLGNESTHDNAATLTVTGTLQENAIIGDVANLTVTPYQNRIVLNWAAPENHRNEIKNYRVYYGLSPNQLTEAVDTFTNSTTWYIPNLRSGVEYYFAVIAVDVIGNVSEHFSNIVSSSPSGVIDVPTPDVQNGTAGEEAILDMESDVSESGPGMTLLIFLSALGGMFYVQAAKKKTLVKQRESNDFWNEF